MMLLLDETAHTAIATAASSSATVINVDGRGVFLSRKRSDPIASLQ